MSDTENIMNFNDLDYVGKEIVENQEATINKQEDLLQTKNEAKFSHTEINDKFQSISLPSGLCSMTLIRLKFVSLKYVT